MTLGKLMLGGIAAIGLTAGAAAYAAEEDVYLIVPQSYEEQASWGDSSYTVYGIDDDRDGRVDRMLILEESDSLG